jgi:tetratricopeptide (TPR) repeat protein
MKEDTVKGLREVKKLLYSIDALSNKPFAFKAIEQIGKICLANNMQQKARYYWVLGLEKTAKEKNTEWQSKFFLKIAEFLQQEDHLKLSLLYFDSALAVTKASDEKLRCNILMLKGRAHYDGGDYKTAMDNYIKSQRLFEKNKWQTAEYGHLLHFIGSVFKRQNFRDKALNYYEKELALAREIKSKSLEAEALYLAAAMYGELGNLDKELDYELKSLKLPKPPSEETQNYDTFQNYEIEAQNRDMLREFLRTRGIGTILPWAGKAIHQFGLEGVRKTDLRKTEELFSKVVLLPMNQYLTIDDITYVVSQIREFYDKKI